MHALDRQFSRGFSYVEVLVATLLIGVSLVPALEALSSGIQSSSAHAAQTPRHTHVVQHLERVAAEPYTRLLGAAGSPTSASSYSQASGGSNRALVYISHYDVDNADGDNNRFTGGEPEMLWIRVAIEGTRDELHTLVTK